MKWHVAVDWSVNTEQLIDAMSRGENFRVIWLRDGLNVYLTGEEPNHLIRKHLREYLMNRPADALQPE
jgi:hypothetical protein